jgi:hypothetical protein
VSANAAAETSEGNDLLVSDDVLQVGHRAVEVHLLDGLGGLAGVLGRTKLEISPDSLEVCGTGSCRPPLNSNLKLISPSFKLRREPAEKGVGKFSSTRKCESFEARKYGSHVKPKDFLTQAIFC